MTLIMAKACPALIFITAWCRVSSVVFANPKNRPALMCICVRHTYEHVYFSWLFLPDDRPGTHVVKYSRSAPWGLFLFRLDFGFISRPLVSFRSRRSFATAILDYSDSSFDRVRCFSWLSSGYLKIRRLWVASYIHNNKLYFNFVL